MILTVTSSPTGFPAYSETFPCAPPSAAGARRLIRTALFTWALDDLADDAALVVSELVANAVRHSGSRRIHVTVTRLAADRVRIAVVDRSAKFPLRRTPLPSDTHGRGLAVIARLAACWGTDPLPRGKRVWGELIRPTAETAATTVGAVGAVGVTARTAGAVR